jgi:biotin transport system substrate-specific component
MVPSLFFKESFMEKAITRDQTSIAPFLPVLFGCSLLVLCTLIRIPMIPVSFTLQTFALYFLGLTLSPKQAAQSVVAYLAIATFGLPVLSVGADPLWFLGKTGGYLLAFPVAAYCIARLGKNVLAMTAGLLLVFLFGFLWLLPFVGAEIAFLKGVAIFIPSEIMKMAAARTLARRIL